MQWIVCCSLINVPLEDLNNNHEGKTVQGNQTGRLEK